jgi:hypothetical protein
MIKYNFLLPQKARNWDLFFPEKQLWNPPDHGRWLVDMTRADQLEKTTLPNQEQRFVAIQKRVKAAGDAADQRRRRRSAAAA